MTPLLLLPAGLTALTALAVPLAIHLTRRSAQQRTEFAALRWLDPKPRARSRLRFDEQWLLAVRLLLLALVALWLARPALSGAADPTPWTAVVAGADLAAVPATGERRWLAPGFPPLDRPVPAGRIPLASLLRQLDAELPVGVALTVVAPPVIDGVDAERPRLSRAVTWRVAGSPPRNAPPAAAATPPVPPLVVRFAPGRAAAVAYLHAAAQAWQPLGRAPAFDAGPASLPLPPISTGLVWLVPGPLPAAVDDWIRHGGTALLDAEVRGTPAATGTIWRDDTGAALVTEAPLGAGRIRQLTRRLAPDALPQLLAPDFPKHLRALFAAPPSLPARVAASDFAPVTGGARYPMPARDVRPWLALLVAGLLLVERWLATARRTRP